MNCKDIYIDIFVICFPSTYYLTSKTTFMSSETSHIHIKPAALHIHIVT